MLDLAEEIYEDIRPEKYEELSIVYAAKSAILQWKNEGEVSLTHAEKCLHLQELACSRSGKESMELSYAWNRVGISLNQCKLYSKAIPYFDQTKRIRKNLPGFQQVHLLGSNYHEGLALFGQGLIVKSETLLLQTLKEWEDAKGPNDMSSFR